MTKRQEVFEKIILNEVQYDIKTLRKSDGTALNCYIQQTLLLTPACKLN